MLAASPDDIDSVPHRKVRCYVFLDIGTCFEANYPVYLGRVRHNSDQRHNRSALGVPAAAPANSKDPTNPSDPNSCLLLPTCRALMSALGPPVWDQ
jgi:hypothetical protein